MKRVALWIIAAALFGCGRSDQQVGQGTNMDTAIEWPTIGAAPPEGWLTVSAAAFSPDSKQLLVGYSDGIHSRRSGRFKSLTLWDVTTGKEIRSWMMRGGDPRYIAFLPDGKQALIAGTDAAIKIWDVTTGTEVRTIAKEVRPIYDQLIFSRNGRRILYFGYADERDFHGKLILRDVATGKDLGEFENHIGASNPVDFSPDSKLAITAGMWNATGDVMFLLWDLDKGKILNSFAKKDQWCFAGGFSPDGKWAVAAKTPGRNWDDARIVIWEVATGNEISRLQGMGGGFLRFSPDSSHVICRDGPDAIQYWDVSTGKLSRVVPVGPSSYCWALSPNLDLLFLARREDTLVEKGLALELWDMNAGKLLRPLK